MGRQLDVDIVGRRHTMDIRIEGKGGGVKDAVRYSPQELTEEQQKQARQNIGAASKEQVTRIALNVRYGDLMELVADDLVELSERVSIINVLDGDRIAACILPSSQDTAVAGWLYEYEEGWWLSRYLGDYEVADHTWADFLDYLDSISAPVVNKDYVDGLEHVFLAEYNVTSYDDIWAASAAGKAIMCLYLGGLCTLSGVTPQGGATFDRISGNSVLTVTCSRTSRWVAGSTGLATADDVSALGDILDSHTDRLNDLEDRMDTKQDTLIAGEGISIAADGKTISATASGGGPEWELVGEYTFDADTPTNDTTIDLGVAVKECLVIINEPITPFRGRLGFKPYGYTGSAADYIGVVTTAANDKILLAEAKVIDNNIVRYNTANSPQYTQYTGAKRGGIIDLQGKSMEGLYSAGIGAIRFCSGVIFAGTTIKIYCK